MSHVPVIIPGLRGPYEKVGDIYLFGRVLDKIRLHERGLLPDAWVAAMGAEHGFDGAVCRFLKIRYTDLQHRTINRGSDEEILAWSFATGRQPSEEDILIWNGFMMKSGWRDAKSERIAFRLAEAGLPPDAVCTMFDFIDLDEGRPRHWG